MKAYTTPEVITKLALNRKPLVLTIENTAPRRTLNVYWRSPSGKPVRRETEKYGDGWDILAKLAEQNGTTVRDICEAYDLRVYGNRVSFV